jgi:hypothetical protein
MDRATKRCFTHAPLAVWLAVGSTILYRRVLKPWHERWGASDEEVELTLPGDELITDAASQVTRAISIDAPAEDVWPWLIQLGADRGGFYSYDWLEDLFGLGIHSAKDIVPEWQGREVGDLVYGDSKGRGGWYVMDVQPNRALVLQTADLKHARPASCNGGAPMEFTWAFVLSEETHGTTRLLVRERVAFRNDFIRSVIGPVGLVSFFMSQKMMGEIKRRAEEGTLTGVRTKIGRQAG